MAKEKKGSGIQQAAGLIRYFDEESEDAIQISKGMIYAACVIFSVSIYLANHVRTLRLDITISVAGRAEPNRIVYIKKIRSCTFYLYVLRCLFF